MRSNVLVASSVTPSRLLRPTIVVVIGSVAPRCPGHNLFHLGQKPVPSRLLFLAGVFRLRKASLALHCPPLGPPGPADSTRCPRPCLGLFQRFPRGSSILRRPDR